MYTHVPRMIVLLYGNTRYSCTVLLKTERIPRSTRLTILRKEY
eukprot:COSAG02_NODE_5234_length_4517_cov_3.884110_5_plen_43_part_00